MVVHTHCFTHTGTSETPMKRISQVQSRKNIPVRREERCVKAWAWMSLAGLVDIRELAQSEGGTR